MGNDKAQDESKVFSVLRLLKSQFPLTLKQEKFCNNACIQRFLTLKGYNVKKAAKQLRNCLQWRDSISADSLMVNQFLGEVVDGVAYVAGHDADSRPVVILKIKQDYPKSKVTRLVVFTLEAAVRTMPKNVDQFVLLFDASFFRSGSAFMNVVLVPTLKMVADYYPCRLHKAFVIDPPSLFPFLWKGMRPFLELSRDTHLVWPEDYQEEEEDPGLGSSFRAATVSKSSRFSVTVSPHLDTLKPWCLSFTDAKSAGPNLNPRSLSFASPGGGRDVIRTRSPHAAAGKATPKAWTPLPGFLQSPAATLLRRGEGNRELFRPYLKFHRRPYDETWYRSKIQ